MSALSTLDQISKDLAEWIGLFRQRFETDPDELSATDNLMMAFMDGRLNGIGMKATFTGRIDESEQGHDFMLEFKSTFNVLGKPLKTVILFIQAKMSHNNDKRYNDRDPDVLMQCEDLNLTILKERKRRKGQGVYVNGGYMLYGHNDEQILYVPIGQVKEWFLDAYTKAPKKKEKRPSKAALTRLMNESLTEDWESYPMKDMWVNKTKVPDIDAEHEDGWIPSDEGSSDEMST